MIAHDKDLVGSDGNINIARRPSGEPLAMRQRGIGVEAVGMFLVIDSNLSVRHHDPFSRQSDNPFYELFFLVAAKVIKPTLDEHDHRTARRYKRFLGHARPGPPAFPYDEPIAGVERRFHAWAVNLVGLEDKSRDKQGEDRREQQDGDGRNDAFESFAAPVVP